MESDEKKRKIAAMCWKRGSEAMAKESWDFAIDMFAQCVTLDPGNLMYRQTLRGVEYRKYGNNKTGARLSGPKLMRIRSKITLAKRSKNWDQLDQEAETGLKINPWDAALNADAAQACEEREFLEVAVYLYERAVEADPKNAEIIERLANVYEQQGEYDKALGAWTRISQLNPGNKAVDRKMTDLHTKKVTHRGGYDEAQSTKQVQVQQRSAYEDFGGGKKEESVAPGQSVEHDLKHAIRKSPNDKGLYQKLGDYYRREDRLTESVEIFKKAVEVSGGDQGLVEELEDTELQLMRKNMETALEKHRATPEDETLRQKAGALRMEFLKRELDVYQDRVNRYPKDLQRKFELAQRLMKFKKWDQAIPLLQAATANNKIETEARVLLGECFLNDGKKPLAIRQFEAAIGQINQHDHPELFLKCHYVLGRLAEEKGDMETAINHYADVLSLDYNYRDARGRMEKLESS